MTQSSLLTTFRSFTAAKAFFGAALLALANFIILGAWSFQLIGGLAPCPLCLDQRVPWYLAIFVGSALTYGLVNSWSRHALLALFGVAAVLMIWAGYEGLFHAGIEYKWWPGPSTCTTGGGVIDPTLDLEQLGRTKVPMCDVVPWSLMGISLAGFNFLFSMAGLGLAMLGLLRVAKG
jgi:disulfide bond formation protein DsbB